MSTFVLIYNENFKKKETGVIYNSFYPDMLRICIKSILRTQKNPSIIVLSDSVLSLDEFPNVRVKRCLKKGRHQIDSQLLVPEYMADEDVERYWYLDIDLVLTGELVDFKYDFSICPYLFHISGLVEDFNVDPMLLDSEAGNTPLIPFFNIGLIELANKKVVRDLFKAFREYRDSSPIDMHWEHCPVRESELYFGLFLAKGNFYGCSIGLHPYNLSSYTSYLTYIDEHHHCSYHYIKEKNEMSQEQFNKLEGYFDRASHISTHSVLKFFRGTSFLRPSPVGIPCNKIKE